LQLNIVYFYASVNLKYIDQWGSLNNWQTNAFPSILLMLYSFIVDIYLSSFSFICWLITHWS
jgi:hypothetical protein